MPNREIYIPQRLGPAERIALGLDVPLSVTDPHPTATEIEARRSDGLRREIDTFNKALTKLAAAASGSFVNSQGHAQRYTREEITQLIRSAARDLGLKSWTRGPKVLP